MIFLSSFQLLGPSRELFFKFSSFWDGPKSWNLKEKSCPAFGFSALFFNFQIENLKNSFWDGPKNWKLERRIMSYLLVFNFGFQFLNWKLGNQFLEGSQKLKTWQKNHAPPSGFQLWLSTFKCWRRRTLCVGGGGISSFFSGGLGVLQVGMSKFVQHTNWGSYKLGCPSLFNIPTTSLKKNLINYSQGGARKISSYHSGALTIALLSWPSFHQDILEKTSWPSFHQDILEKTVCWRRRTLCVGGGGISSFFSGGLGVLQVGMSKFVQHTNHLPEKKLDKLYR